MIRESVLERVAKEVPNSPHPSPFPQEKNPFVGGNWFDIGRRAVEILEDVGEIKDFMIQYITHTIENYGLSMEEAEEETKKTVGYCTGYVDDVQANRWFSSLPDISHPVTKRERPFKGGDNVNMYYIIGKSDDQQIRDYLRKTIPYDFLKSGFHCIEEDQLLEGRDNSTFFAFKLEPPKDAGFIGNEEVYLLLAGYVPGLSSRMEQEIGKTCKLILETTHKV